MKRAVSVREIIKDFRVPGSRDRLRAVDNLTLSIKENSVYGLLGPNGSGKSTTIKIILGLLKASEGTCQIFGISSENPAARINVGYLPEAPYFQRFLTGRELIRYFGRLSNLGGVDLDHRIEALLKKVGLEDAGDRRIGSYSKGMLQRIGMAQALVGDPKLLILDEPTAGVDPIGAADIAELILSLKAEGKTVLLCSHLLSQVEAICDRVAIMGKGRLLREGTVESLIARDGESSSIQVDGLSPASRQSMEEWVAKNGGSVSASPKSLEALFLELARTNGEVSEE